MEFKEDNKINYPKWSTLKYTDPERYPVKSISMVAENVIIGYAVIIFPTDEYFDYGYYGKYSKCPYLASFEIRDRYRKKGYGKILLKHTIKIIGSIILRPINDTSEFYQSNGGKIIIGDLWEGCTMIIKK